MKQIITTLLLAAFVSTSCDRGESATNSVSGSGDPASATEAAKPPRYRLLESSHLPILPLHNLTSVFVTVSQLGERTFFDNQRLLRTAERSLTACGVQTIAPDEARELMGRRGLTVPNVHLRIRTTGDGVLVSHSVVLMVREFAVRTSAVSDPQWASSYAMRYSGFSHITRVVGDLDSQVAEAWQDFSRLLHEAKALKLELPRNADPEAHPAIRPHLTNLFGSDGRGIDLKGIRELWVPAATLVGPNLPSLRELEVRRRVEKGIEALGIRLIPADEAARRLEQQDPDIPALSLSISFVTNDQGMMGCEVCLTLEETWLNPRNPGYPYRAGGWFVVNHWAGNTGVRTAALRAIDDSLKFLEWSYRGSAGPEQRALPSRPSDQSR